MLRKLSILERQLGEAMGRIRVFQQNPNPQGLKINLDKLFHYANEIVKMKEEIDDKGKDVRETKPTKRKSTRKNVRKPRTRASRK